ncbi:MAG: glycosyltransferase family 4 protein, partial [Planctomycetes bacterium]|nr:glycosyltransferase family 4 protein [Planctomycetota bacterium]
GFDYSPFDPGKIKEENGIAPMAPTVLFVGSLTHRKGPDLLLEAIPSVREKHPTAVFVFVGDGDLREHLEREIERHGIKDNVRFTGFKKSKDTLDLYRACDLVCSTSRQDPFGIVTLSAWAASKPVVATRVGATLEIIKDRDTGFLAELTPESIAEKILDGLDDFDLLRWIGRNGRVAAETAFSWKTIADKTEKAISRTKRLAKA